jgi:hypothetical protein
MERPKDGKYVKGTTAVMDTCGCRRIGEGFLQDGLEYSIYTSIPELII